MAYKKSDKKSAEHASKAQKFGLTASAAYMYGAHSLGKHNKKAIASLGAAVGLTIGDGIQRFKAYKSASSAKQKTENNESFAVTDVANISALLLGGLPLAVLAKGMGKVRNTIKAAGDTLKKSASSKVGDAVKGSVLNKNGGKVKFVRIRGRIVPIRKALK